MYCFRIYDISGSSDEESGDSDADEHKDKTVKKAVTGMHANSTVIFCSYSICSMFVQTQLP